jgi:hypothetical protein
MLRFDVEYWLELSGDFDHFQMPWPLQGHVIKFRDMIYIGAILEYPRNIWSLQGTLLTSRSCPKG